jgi:hypothetical protein
MVSTLSDRGAQAIACCAFVRRWFAATCERRGRARAGRAWHLMSAGLTAPRAWALMPLFLSDPAAAAPMRGALGT